MPLDLDQTKFFEDSENCNIVTQIQHSGEQKPYYADTAYTPDKVKTLEATWGLEQFSSVECSRRKVNLKREKYCAHIMPRIGEQAINFLHLYGENKFNKKFKNKKNHEEYVWLNTNNEWFQLKRLALLMTITGIIAVLVIIFNRLEETAVSPEFNL